jgi:hypothetical protein
VALLRRGGQAVSGFAAATSGRAASGPAGHGIDAAGVAQSAADLAHRIEQDGLAALAPAVLSFRLAGPVR